MRSSIPSIVLSGSSVGVTVMVGGACDTSCALGVGVVPAETVVAAAAVATGLSTTCTFTDSKIFFGDLSRWRFGSYSNGFGWLAYECKLLFAAVTTVGADDGKLASGYLIPITLSVCQKNEKKRMHQTSIQIEIG